MVTVFYATRLMNISLILVKEFLPIILLLDKQTSTKTNL